MDNCVLNRMGRGRRTLCAGLCVAALALAPMAASADDGGVAGTAKEGGLGIAAALTTLVYGPVKVVYAIGGTVASGLAWGFSGGDGEVATTVLTRAVRGTYVITPQTLQGQEEIEFVGRAPQYRTGGRPAQVASAPPDSAVSDGW